MASTDYASRFWWKGREAGSQQQPVLCSSNSSKRGLALDMGKLPVAAAKASGSHQVGAA